MRLFKLLSAAAMLFAASPASALTFSEMVARLESAKLLDAFYVEANFEPLPSGKYILEGLSVLSEGRVVPYEHVGGDGGGGAYIVLEDGRFALVGSEGSAGLLGNDLRDAISLMIGFGSWGDAVQFLAAPTKDEARYEWDTWRTEWGVTEGPSDPAVAKRISQALDLAPVKDPFGELYDILAAGGELTFRAAEGDFINYGRAMPQPD